MLEFFQQESPEVTQVREAAKAFADARLRPTAIEDDENCIFRRDVFNEAGKLGFLKLIAPKQFGGKQSTYLSYYAMLEEISRVSLSTTVTIGVTHLLQGVIATFGSSEQKSMYLPKLLSAEWLGAFSLSEPGAGSDAASLKCAAKKTQGGYLLNGTKCWCSSAGHADMYVVMARTGEHPSHGISAFLVGKDTPGFRVGKQEDKLGLRASSLCELIFEDCFIPERDRIGQEGEGLKIALSQLDAGRVVIGIAGVGVAIESIERLFRFRLEEEKKNPALPFSEGVQHLLAQYYAELLAVKALIATAGRMRDENKSITTIASAIKRLGSDLAMKVTSDVVEHFGEHGYLREYEVERFMRDAKALQIVEGTNQIQMYVLAREMRRMLQ